MTTTTATPKVTPKKKVLAKKIELRDLTPFETVLFQQINLGFTSADKIIKNLNIEFLIDDVLESLDALDKAGFTVDPPDPLVHLYLPPQYNFNCVLQAFSF